MALHTLAIVVLILYLLATGAFLFRGATQREQPSRFSEPCLGVAFLIHSVMMIIFLFEGTLVNVQSGADLLFYLSWILPGAYLAASRKVHYPILAAFVAGAAALFLTSSSLLAHGGVESRAGTGSSIFILLHVAPAVLGKVCLAFSLIVSAIFLIQEKRLKSKKLISGALSGPNLKLLEQYNKRFVLVGFVALTLAVISGVLWAVSNGQAILTGDIIQWSALGAWLLLAVILHMSTSLRSSTRQISLLTLYGTGAYYAAIFLAVAFGSGIIHVYN